MGETLLAVITFLATKGISVVGQVEALAKILFPEQALTDAEINAANQRANDEDDAIIARRTDEGRADPPAEG